MINIGIIGVGRWGTNYLRVFNELSNANVKWICATKKSTLIQALRSVKLKNKVKSTTDYKDILKDREVDAVAIASSGSTHYKFSKEALQHNKHVLVEKPVAFSSRDVKNLIRISNKTGKVLMAGHLHLYNSGIQKLKSDIANGAFGKVSQTHFSHFGNGPIRSDMSALWDFFTHSVSIILYLFDKMPVSVGADGLSYIKKGNEDMVAMNLKLPSGISAVSIGSWLYPIKKMEIIVIGDKKYAAFDDYAEKDKLKYYDVSDKKERFVAPRIKNTRPLTMELHHFLDCIENKKQPVSNGFEALKVVKVLECAQRSLENEGVEIYVA